MPGAVTRKWIDKYGTRWPAEDTDLQIEMGCIQMGGRWKLYAKGGECGLGLEYHFEQMRRLLWPQLDDHRWHKLCRDNQIQHKICVLMGPGSCVVGETELLDPITGECTPIKVLAERGKRPQVMTLAGPALARVPFLKGYSDLVEVTLRSGKRFIATPGHLVLTEFGFRPVSSLRSGQSLLSYEPSRSLSSSGLGQRWSFSNARNLLETESGSQSDYPRDYRSYGGQLLSSQGGDQGVPTSLIGAQGLSHSFGHSDDPETRPARNHLCLYGARLSKMDALDRGFRKEIDALLDVSSKRFLRASDSCEPQRQFSSAIVQTEPFQGLLSGSSRSCLSHEKPFDKYRVQADTVQQIRSAGFGPFYDLQVPGAHHYFAEGTIHHNSGKTNEAAWLRLCQYYCFPTETLVLVSSTDLRGLQLRVWGEIKMLHEQAKQAFPQLPGHLVESKLCICTDNIDEGEARDLRRGIIGIPCIQNGKYVGLGKYCFPSGTRVDTPSGPRKIETLIPGDIVLSAVGQGKIEAVARHHSPLLVRVHCYGRTIDCTPNHRFLTTSGWRNAIDLSQSDQLVLWHEAVSCLREEGTGFEGPWVESVEILKGDARYEASRGGYPVYNLEVEGHPSYSVEGVIVHNCGIKQKRVYLVADEAQFMGASFLSAFANLDKNENFAASVLGNPNDPLDPLGKAAEPLDGWSGHLEPEKTSVWPTRFMNGVCVNLIGTDSPNFDSPETEPTRYKYLISREKIANTVSFFPKDSVEYYSQCVGAMKIGVMARRVINRDLVAKFGARDKVTWAGSALVRIFALDAAYGGDRCVGGHILFGRTIEGRIGIKVEQPQIVPIIVKSDTTPEEQIAEWIKDYCETNDIPPENAFHDSTGRGGLGTAIARVFSDQCNPVEFGGKATPRPVSLDMYIYDMKEKRRRLKRCDEHYDRFVTELWWSIRLCIESKQLFELPEDVMEEFCMREWDKIKEGKIKLETKKEMKERVGRSPDLGDWAAIAVEGARRRGFQIDKLGNVNEDEDGGMSWLEDLQRTARNTIRAHQLARA